MNSQTNNSEEEDEEFDWEFNVKFNNGLPFCLLKLTGNALEFKLELEMLEDSNIGELVSVVALREESNQKMLPMGKKWWYFQKFPLK